MTTTITSNVGRDEFPGFEAPMNVPGNRSRGALEPCAYDDHGVSDLSRCEWKGEVE